MLDWVLSGVTSWKTTLAAVIGFAAVILQSLGVVTITPEQQGVILAFALLVVGWFARDANKQNTDKYGE